MRFIPFLLLAGLGASPVGGGAIETHRAGGVPAQAPAQTGPPELTEPLEITEELLALKDSVEAVLLARDTIVGPQRQVQISRMRGWIRRSLELQEELIGMISDPATPSGGDAGASRVEGDGSSGAAEEGLSLIRSRVEDYTTWLQAAYRDLWEREQATLDRLIRDRAEAEPEELPVIDSEWRLRSGQMDTLLLREAELLSNAQALGVEVEEGWRELEQAGVSRADGLAGQLQLLRTERERVRRAVADGERSGLSEGEIARLRNDAQTVERRLEDLGRSLSATSDILDARGLETTGYRRLIIETTGVTGDILDREILQGLLSDTARSLGDWVRTRGPTVLLRGIIVLFFVAVGRYGARLVWWLLSRLGVARLPRLAAELVGRMVGPLGTLIGLGIGLAAIGVETTTVLAGAGVAGVVLGFALQDSIANFAAGFLILLYRPFDQDDVIEAAGVVGTVRSMGLANTTLLTFDNRRVSIPNSKLWGTVIANRSSEPRRRAEALLRVGFDQDLSEVSTIVLEGLREHPLVLADPAPSLYVSGTGESWMEVTVWAWAQNADWWAVTVALPELMKTALEEQGIPVPLPTQRVVGLGESNYEATVGRG